MRQKLRAAFLHKFGTQPILVRAPGRINLIGDHTDYHQGLVLPAAINAYMYVGIQKNTCYQNRLYAADLKAYLELDLQSLTAMEKLPSWARYIVGMLDWMKQQEPDFPTIDLLISSTLPIGGGLSSSAALCNALGLAFMALIDKKPDPKDIIFAAQKTEHVFAGVQCGIMDQYASMFGKSQQALLLDCRTIQHQWVPCQLENYQFVLFDTGVKHNLAESAYNMRQQECSIGLKMIQKSIPGIDALSAVSIREFLPFKNHCDPLIFDRCMFVLEENDRVLKSYACLQTGDAISFGNLMYASHAGLSKKYGVSCSELDFLVALTEDYAPVLGARMMGGGFGGNTLNLIHKSEKDTVIQACKEAYKQQFSRPLETYEVSLVDGASTDPFNFQ
ncbi:MAG: galactokinase [Nitritalea sp.]